MSDFDWPALTDAERVKLLRDMLADAWDECNDQWRRRGLTPDFPNPYRAD